MATIFAQSHDSCFFFRINYARNPKLCYLYPPPTVSILTNVANALAASPKFYVQVRHVTSYDLLFNNRVLSCS